MAKGAVPGISVDFRQNRVRVHKCTLHMLGDPEFVRLLVNPEERLIAIQITDSDDPSGHHVRNRTLSSKNCFEIHSMPLLENLQKCTSWDDNSTYSLIAHSCVDNSMMVFKIDEARKLN